MIVGIGIFLLFSVLCFVYVKTKFSRGDASDRKLPPMYPGALPIIGHAHLLLGDNACLWDLVNTLGKVSIEHGGVMLCYIGNVKYYEFQSLATTEKDLRETHLDLLDDAPQSLFHEFVSFVVVITDPDDFTTGANQCLRKHFAYNFLKSWLGDGLVSGLDTAKWKRHRKLLSPAFSQRVLNDFLIVFNSQAKQLVSALSDQVGKGPFNHAHYVDQEALENICRTSFGISNYDKSIFDEIKYMKAVHQILNIITTRFQKFWMHSDFIYSYTGLKKRETNVVKYLNDTCDAVLRMKRDNLFSDKKDKNTDGAQYKAFMDLILELSVDGTLTNEEIWEEMNTIILAGYETVGNSLLYTMIMLGSHLDVQEKVFQELDNVFGKSDRDVNKEDLSKLVYLEAVLKETLRVLAVTPIMMRYVDKEVKLKNYTMPVGSNCLLFVNGLHFHPIWGPDADVFKPERWLDPVAVSNPKSALYKAYSPFGVGKRLCMGKNFAMMSMKTTLAHVMRRYRVTADVTKLKLKVDPLLKPVSGHEISLEYRA